MTDDTKKEGTLTLGRRKFLKGTASTLPLLATIPSGAAATARSSNYVSYLEYGDSDANYSSDAYIRCLDEGAVNDWIEAEQLAKLDDNPWGYNIPKSSKYYKPKKYDNDKPDTDRDYNADYVCDKGGKFFTKVKVNGYYKWHEVRLPNNSGYLPDDGVILSATALQSFGGGYFNPVKLTKIS